MVAQASSERRPRIACATEVKLITPARSPLGKHAITVRHESSYRITGSAEPNLLPPSRPKNRSPSLPPFRVFKLFQTSPIKLSRPPFVPFSLSLGGDPVN